MDQFTFLGAILPYIEKKYLLFGRLNQYFASLYLSAAPLDKEDPDEVA
jgi:hypothetical protein